MNLSQHLMATGIVAAAIASTAHPEEIALFAAGSVLIDIDHLVFYYSRTGRCDISGMFRYFRITVDENLERIPYLGICVFHTVEFVLGIAALAFFLPQFRFLLYGILFHLLLDIICLIRLKIPFIRAYSFIEHLIRRRQKGYPFA
jgi:hypothetical protein